MRSPPRRLDRLLLLKIISAITSRKAVTEESTPAKADREASGVDWNPGAAATGGSSLSSRSGEGA
jgi:hypothetical protein